jgi:hypothetical protein
MRAQAVAQARAAVHISEPRHAPRSGRGMDDTSDLRRELEDERTRRRRTGLWCFGCGLSTLVLGLLTVALLAVLIGMAFSQSESCTAQRTAATAANGGGGGGGGGGACAAGTYELPATGACYACPQQCTACAAGGACTACIPGYALDHAESPVLCKPCAPGSTGAGGVCTACAVGTYTAQLGSSVCVACPGECAPGACAPASGACTACRAGARRTLAGRCVPCNGTTWSAGGTQDFCAPCGGVAGACACCNATSGVCAYCAPGRGTPDCVACEAGEWSNGGAPCAPCPGDGCLACVPETGDCTACEAPHLLVAGRCVLLLRR